MPEAVGQAHAVYRILRHSATPVAVRQTTLSGEDVIAYQSSLITSRRRNTSDRKLEPLLAFSVIIALFDAL